MPQDTPYKPSGWAIFDQVLGGRTITDARDTLIAREQARRAREQEMDALAAFGETVRGMMGGTPGGAGAPDPVSAEMSMLSGSMQNAPGPKTYSAPIGPGMDGEPLPAVRQEAPRPPPQQAQRQPASLPAGPPRLPTYRDFAPVLAEAVMSGNPTVAARASALAGVFDKAGPSIKYERGMRYDERDPSSAPGYIPDLAEGQLPAFDADGRLLGVMNASGYVQSIAEVEAAKTRATEGAKAGFDLVEVPQADGSMRMLPRDQALAAMGGGSGGLPALPGSTGPRSPVSPVSPAGGASGGFGVRQSPAAQAAQTDAAKRQVELDFMRPKAESALQQFQAKSDIVDQAIDRATDLVGGFTAGMGSLLGVIPGTPAKDLGAELETIKANLGFDELQTMRDNSPTGGALGQVAVQELQSLQAAMANLQQDQSPEALAAALKRLKEVRQAAAQRRDEAFARTFGGGSGAVLPPPPSKSQLVVGQTYQTPRGPMTWNGKAFVQ